ncbi:MAG: polysaccharide biosynthesis tyrosine autokinase [Syntrophobacteraceae bacterium]|jgi:capsular exopolysaccharide synthesis family protein|nr:polysaccharide biosynthesis tyrosine autokinase [Syntrophobacteraceae bacterium]MCU0589473.1 polysaccharide biosynthesis tyrosine autokinase [Syntrophobacteraceae bacterium]
MIHHSDKSAFSNLPASIPRSQAPSTEVYEPVPEFEDSADLRDYLEVVFRRKWLVVTFLAVVFTAVLVVSLVMKPVYRATGRLELSIHAPKVTKFEDMVASQMQTREFMQTQVKLLQSESLARRVVGRLGLDRNPVFNPAVEERQGGEKWLTRFRKTVKGWLAFGPGSETEDPALAELAVQKAVEAKFAKSLEVQAERDTTIISLGFKCVDPLLGKDVINALIQEFTAWQMDKKIDAAVNAKQQLEKQLDVARIQLEKAESNLNAFSQKAGIVSLNSNLNLIYRQLEEMNNGLASAESDRIGKEALHNQALMGNVSALPNVLENELIQKLREEYVKIMAQYQELYATFKDDYPAVKNLKARLNDLEKKIAGEENRIAESLKSSYQTALRREDSLRREADEKKASALALNNQATQYKILEREVETSKSIHQSLLERSKEIDAKVGTELGNIQVVDYASRPLKPYRPNIPLNLLLALVVGLMGGVGLAFFLEYMDNTVKRIDEFSDRFQLPILGVLPMAEQEEQKDLDRLVRVKPRASFSESIRTAKVSIQLSSAMDAPPKSLVITSTTAGEGKSTIACNLAQAFVSAEERVVIIDADLRKPRLHRVFGTGMNGNGSSGSNRRKGLSQLLSGICEIEDVLQSTDVPNLSFISAGPTPPNPAELLASSRMRKVLDTLSREFDRIIIDAPPAAGFADVLVLSNCADGVILVSTLGLTHREALRVFRRSIYGVRGNLLGCMVNRLSTHGHFGNYYYYKYYKYYSQYYQTSPVQPQPSDALPELPPNLKQADEARVA